MKKKKKYFSIRKLGKLRKICSIFEYQFVRVTFYVILHDVKLNIIFYFFSMSLLAAHSRLSPKKPANKALLKAELKLNMEEAKRLKEINDQLEIEAGNLRKQSQCLKRAIKQEKETRKTMIMEEEKKSKLKLSTLEDQYQLQYQQIHDQKRKEVQEKLNPITSKLNEIETANNDLNKYFTEERQSIREFIYSSRDKLLDLLKNNNNKQQQDNDSRMNLEKVLENALNAIPNENMLGPIPEKAKCEICSSFVFEEPDNLYDA